MRMVVPLLKQFDYVFKISGRYVISDDFDIGMYVWGKGATAYHLTEKYSDIQDKSYVWGSYATNLYGVNMKYLSQYRMALALSCILLRVRPYSIELVLPYMMHILRIPFRNLPYEPCHGLLARTGQPLIHNIIE